VPASLPARARKKTRFWRPTTRSGWAPFFFLLSCSLKSRTLIDVPDPEVNPKFRHKLDFLEAMEAWFRGLRDKRTSRMILVGDLNVAPLKTDVWLHKQLLRVVSQTPAEVERFERMRAAYDWVDVMRRPRAGGAAAVHLVELPQS
jgi:hypothetical protein